MLITLPQFKLTHRSPLAQWLLRGSWTIVREDLLFQAGFILRGDHSLGIKDDLIVGSLAAGPA